MINMIKPNDTYLTYLKSLIDKLAEKHSLSLEEYESLLSRNLPELMQYAAHRADLVRKNIYGTDIYIRGLIEASNHCKK